MKVLKVGLAQIAPVWMDKTRTLEKVEEYLLKAATENCKMVVFGEALVPGYPFWLSLTDGARFESELQKELHCIYVEQAVELSDLAPVCQLAREHKISLYLGAIEKAADRGGHSLYCTLFFINSEGEIGSSHRKLQPTYEERLSWSMGDANGLKVHALNEFRVGGLNCWENWMPLSRATLYAQGENVHVAVWPGNLRNTEDITRFIAKESRSFVVSVSGLFHSSHLPENYPAREMMLKKLEGYAANGGSCVAKPNGEWLLPPQIEKEGLFTAELSLRSIFAERQNFDPSGHYARPELIRLQVDHERYRIWNS